MMSVAKMLEVHREVWDMPSLLELAPEVVTHLAERYEVVFPEMFTGQVYVEHKHDGSYRLEKMGTTDVRVAVAALLEREVAQEQDDPEGEDPTRLAAGDGSAQRYFTETSL